MPPRPHADYAPTVEETPRYASRNWRAEAWERERLRELRAICNRHGILLVVDEVQSGAGRTGKWWAIEHSGVEPDMVCMAKGIASGMPLGICMARRASNA